MLYILKQPNKLFRNLKKKKGMTCESRVKMVCIYSFKKKKINSKLKLTINNAKSTWNDIAFFFLKFFLK